MSKQLTLQFKQSLIPIARTADPVSSHRAAAEITNSGRRKSQYQKILNRLRHGPATNKELALLSLKYTSRISDLRVDYDIPEPKHLGGGVYEYCLIE